MHEVIIVDDEPIIRFGLKSSIKWEEEGLHLIGDFSNGKQALDAIQKQIQVDILITDIKMPVMDGIHLMKKALALFPKLKVILVSSYNDFEYIREGLQYGAIDYVLKASLEPDALLKIIKKCTEKLKIEKEEEEALRIANQTNVLLKKKKMAQEVRKVLLGETEVNNLTRFFPAESPYTTIYIKMKNIQNVEEEKGILFKSLLLEEIQALYYEEHGKGILFPISDVEMFYLCPVEKDPIEVIQYLQKMFTNITSIPFYYGYTTIKHVYDLPIGYQKSYLACSQHFFDPSQLLFCYDDKIAGSKRTESVKYEKLKELLFPYEETKARSILEEIFKHWRQEEYTPDAVRKEACEIISILFMNKIEVTQWMEQMERVKNAESVHSVIQILSSLFGLYEKIIHSTWKKKYTENELVENALEYIHANFTKELTLQSVASHIHISRNYFSILFKRLVHQNFIDYVIDLRIKKAKELLKNSTKKVYEVAEESGFNDVKYFSKLFKKVTGMSPGEYRVYKHNGG